MKQKIYQIDAFTDQVFSGNPAAVCPLVKWLSDELLQKIAAENNLAETAFYLKHGEDYQIRWFTPTLEVDLCGHATLAAAHVLFNYENHSGSIIKFNSKNSGQLRVTKDNDYLTLNFPTDSYEEISLTKAITSGFDILPIQAFKGKSDLLLVFETEDQVRNLQVNLIQVAKLEGRGVIVTAKGDHVDFVSRFFAPQSGIDEDPVTGSAHTTLIPFWAQKLHKTVLSAVQLSPRQGFLQCKYLVDRVEISGKAKTYLIGEIFTE